MRMNLPAALATTFAIVSAPALAADAVETEVPFTWSGAYVGISAGIASTTGDAFLTDVQGDLLRLDVSNGLFPRHAETRDNELTIGVQAGYDVQVGSFVFGGRLGVDFQPGDGAETRASEIDPNCDPVPGVGAAVFCNVLVDSQYMTERKVTGTAELRGGIAVGRAMIFGTAGVALAQIENTFALQITPTDPDPATFRGVFEYDNTFSSDETLWGVTVGAGVEYAVTDAVSFSADYRYLDFEDVTMRATDEANFGDQFLEYTFENRGHIGRVGFNYRF